MTDEESMTETFNYPQFYRLVASYPYINYVEVGVSTGGSVCFLARVLIDQDRLFNLWAVDLWDSEHPTADIGRVRDVEVWNKFQARLDAYGVRGRITVLKAESVAASTTFRDESADFVFLDANHTKEAVLADIAAWWPKIRPGGMLAGHDYGEPCQVKEAVDEVFPGQINVLGTCWYTIKQNQ
jgi:cephalosporin hydroxylase